MNIYRISGFTGSNPDFSFEVELRPGSDGAPRIDEILAEMGCFDTSSELYAELAADFTPERDTSLEDDENDYIWIFYGTGCEACEDAAGDTGPEFSCGEYLCNPGPHMISVTKLA